MSELKSRSILGCPIHGTSYSDAVERIVQWSQTTLSCYIIPANVHVIMTAYWDKSYQQIVKNSQLVTPDGMPLVWGLRGLGLKKQTRVYGPDLMIALCERAEKEKIPLYFYGSTENTLQQLITNLKKQFPTLNIVGHYSPPFRQLTALEMSEDVDRINQTGAKIVFIGLGCPKQEQWMAQQRGKIQAVMLGVGAAFRFHSGEISQAPRWVMQWGLEWLYRLVTEPQRLWKRYLINNPVFIILFTLQLLREKILGNNSPKQ